MATSVLGDIESGVVALIEGIEDQGAPLFASVGGSAAVDRKSALATISRLAKPAVLVIFDGRERYSSARGLPGDPRITVVIAGVNLRSADGARLGDVDAAGVFHLSQAVSVALEGAVIDETWRLAGLDEQIIAADERSVVIEQRWLVDRPTSLTSPTCGGEAIAGADSVVSVTVGERKAAAVGFAFPGVDGEFRHCLGLRDRTIVWSGQLQGSSHAALDAIEEGIEAVVGDGVVRTVEDSLGHSFSGCVVKRFERVGPRGVHPAGGFVCQNFELGFVQLSGTA